VWTKVIRPQLADHGGWATFIGTPKGREPVLAAVEEGRGRSRLAADVLKASETRILSDEELADVRKTLGDDEYARSSNAASTRRSAAPIGAKEIAALDAAGQITDVPWDSGLRVYAAWDLGMADSTVIWLFQPHRGPARSG
jgi:hypothetical protein